MPDVVMSHLNALAAKDKKMISSDPVSKYHGLVIPDDTPHHNADDTYFSPLPTEAPVTTEDCSFYSTDDHDSPDRWGEYEEIYLNIYQIYSHI